MSEAALRDKQLLGSSAVHVVITRSESERPPVVFESGLGRVLSTWDPVIREIAKTNTTLAYDRPGVGLSQPTDLSRAGDAIVQDLRALLAPRLRGPYVLVGHSSGGLYQQLFARLHPKETAGLILVDSTHPTQFEGDGASAAQEFSTSVLATEERFASMKREFDALTETGRAVLAAPLLPSEIPTIILTAPDPSGSPSAVFNNAKRADFMRLYPHADYREVQCGHDIPLECPDAVIEAIWQVLGRTGSIT